MEQTNSTGKVIELLNDNADTKDNMTFGGIDFNDCIINDRYNRNFLTFTDNVNTGKGIRYLKGSIVVNNPNGAKTSIGSISEVINLQITENKSMPPQVNITSPLLLQKKEVGDNTPISLKAIAYDFYPCWSSTSKIKNSYQNQKRLPMLRVRADGFAARLSPTSV